MIKKKIPTKHLHKHITDKQDSEIREICFRKKISFQEAKHIYFERGLEKWF